MQEVEYGKLKKSFNSETASDLSVSRNYSQRVILILLGYNISNKKMINHKYIIYFQNTSFWSVFNHSYLQIFSFLSLLRQIWLVGDELSEEEQIKAPKGTLFIPYSQFPPKKYRKDCFYHTTPAMLTPISLENVHSCEVSQSTLPFHILLLATLTLSTMKIENIILFNILFH